MQYAFACPGSASPAARTSARASAGYRRAKIPPRPAPGLAVGGFAEPGVDEIKEGKDSKEGKDGGGGGKKGGKKGKKGCSPPLDPDPVTPPARRCKVTDRGCSCARLYW